MPIRKCSWCHSQTHKFYSSLTLENNKYHFCSRECFEQWREKKSKRCFCCGQTIFDSAYMVQYGDGRVSCLDCYQRAVTTPEQLENCRQRVLHYFLENYLYIPICGVVPELCDKLVFENNLKFISVDVSGAHVLKQNDRMSQCKIFILRGLPVEAFEETMVHEFAHDMMYHTWGYTDDHVISEGFAEFIAYRYNEQNDRTILNQRMLHGSNKNPYGESGDPYKEGLQLLLSLYEEKQDYGIIKQFITDFFNAHKR